MNIPLQFRCLAVFGGVFLLSPAFAAPEGPSPEAAVPGSKGAGKVVRPFKSSPFKGDLGNTKQDLYANSEVLVGDGVHCTLPKGAVLWIPPHLADRHRGSSRVASGSRWMRWPEFLLANGTWLVEVPVSREEALGSSPLAEGKIKALLAGNRVAVTTLNRNPVSFVKRPASLQPESGTPPLSVTPPR